MIQRILVLETDKPFVLKLVKALNGIGRFTIAAFPTVKDACLLLTQQKQDLAFIPIAEGAKIVRSLRAIQPDLRLVLTSPTADVTIPETYSGQVQGVLLKSHLQADLFAVLEKALDLPLLPEFPPTTPAEKAIPHLDTAVLITVLQQIPMEQLIQTAVFSRGTTLLAHWGHFNEAEATAVALQVGDGWQQETTRLQFFHLPARPGDCLLFTRRVSQNYLLTLVALPETPLNQLRLQAEKVLPTLADVIQGKLPIALALVDPKTAEPYRRPSYAIAWKPLHPLSATLIIPLRRAIERLASINGCILTFISVETELVHLVVACPPGRDDVRVAYLFKNGSEEIIQREYGEATSLWQPGFYATESNSPLSPAELNILLERARDSLVSNPG